MRGQKRQEGGLWAAAGRLPSMNQLQIYSSSLVAAGHSMRLLPGNCGEGSGLEDRLLQATAYRALRPPGFPPSFPPPPRASPAIYSYSKNLFPCPLGSSCSSQRKKIRLSILCPILWIKFFLCSSKMNKRACSLPPPQMPWLHFPSSGSSLCAAS